MSDEAVSSRGVGVPESRRPYVPGQKLTTEYPLIDSDPHIKRVIRYARPVDYAEWGAITAAVPAGFYLLEKFSPSFVGRGAYPPMFRLATMLGFTGGFLALTTNSTLRFLGVRENQRERDMDMREMVDKVKKGEPLYGVSRLSDHHQGVAMRNSRYSTFFIHVMPMFNFVNHNQHGVDTAKYYQQAERELEAEKTTTDGFLKA
ncbi:hypothetical protein NA57DRAFT_76708 [Rhizodiscina lignyota]|uniref:NADH-ubiquinone oxidoreductase 21 kDa subunit n=1 Tax=Rhizodiscina lignyota TaxID=1504668 RepID=A0A9P4IDA8_9PEZI|nr:hypothetical protein NA57DRAFT_76708 [Rhizodiscina lignyota]